MNEKDIEVEDLLSNENKEKKKIDGKAKGNRTEHNLCKLLTDHFQAPFSKAPGSGAFTSQIAHLPDHAKKTLTGDVCGPEKFKWVIECKGGYEKDIDFACALDGNGISRVDEFIEQSSKDADYSGRNPIICWKRNRKPWLTMIRNSDCPMSIIKKDFQYILIYRDWFVVSLKKLLEVTKKDFWFEE